MQGRENWVKLLCQVNSPSDLSEHEMTEQSALYNPGAFCALFTVWSGIDDVCALLSS